MHHLRDLPPLCIYSTERNVASQRLLFNCRFFVSPDHGTLKLKYSASSQHLDDRVHLFSPNPPTPVYTVELQPHTYSQETIKNSPEVFSISTQTLPSLRRVLNHQIVQRSQTSRNFISSASLVSYLTGWCRR